MGLAPANGNDGLLDLHQLVRTRIEIANHTRVSTTIFERESNREYRIVPAGPTIAEAEWRECLDRLGAAKCDYLVVSGSLPPGVPRDFYARIAAIARDKDIRMVLDSSGESLSGGLSGERVFLVKPSLSELRHLAGHDLDSDEAIAAAALELVEQGRAEHVAVTLAHAGALLANKDGVLRVPAIPVKAKSAVGAGDSFLAAMTHALVSGRSPADAFRFGVAAGAAAVLTPGTDLCHPADIYRLYAEMPAG
jgi:6-phosphofructokinase 2